MIISCGYLDSVRLMVYKLTDSYHKLTVSSQPIKFQYFYQGIKFVSIALYSYFKDQYHSHQSKYKIIKMCTVTERFCYCLFGYNYNKNIITSSGFLKYFMTNSSGSSQCDPELAIPDIFLDMETNLSYQAIGSERQIFSMSVNKTLSEATLVAAK